MPAPHCRNGSCRYVRALGWSIRANLIFSNLRNNYKTKYRGIMKSHIFYNSTSKHWILESFLKPGFWLETKHKFTSQIPIGTHNWIVGSENGLCQKEAGSIVVLTFSACYPNKYTCNSGHCIPLRYSSN